MLLIVLKPFPLVCVCLSRADFLQHVLKAEAVEDTRLMNVARRQLAAAERADRERAAVAAEAERRRVAAEENAERLREVCPARERAKGVGCPSADQGVPAASSATNNAPTTFNPLPFVIPRPAVP